MAAYGFDTENEKNLPEQIIADQHLMSASTPYVRLSSEYMTETVTRLLLAKNRHLTQDKNWQYAQEENKRLIQEDAIQLAQNDSDESYIPNEKEENERSSHIQNYLDKMVIMQDGHAITDEKEMRDWVTKNFHFTVSDIENPNAFICQSTKLDYPKDTIAFTTSMLNMAQTSEQFDGIIAHELGHYFVHKIYEDKYISPSMDERLADKHAADCLYYSGQNPNSYADTFALLNNLDELTEEQKLYMAGEAHDSPIARIKNIRDYNEAVYSSYMQDYVPSQENEINNQRFQSFKQETQPVYNDSRYISKLEELISQDPEFSVYKDTSTGQIDFSKIPYEKTIDKILSLSSDSTMIFDSNLEDITEIISRASQQDVTYTPELTEKLSQLVAKASDSIYIQKHQQMIDKDLSQKFKSENQDYDNMPVFRPLSYDIYEQAQKEELSLSEIAEKIEKTVLDRTEKNSKADENTPQLKTELKEFERQILRIHRPQSPLLSEAEKNNRTQNLNTEPDIIEMHTNKQYHQNLDKLIATIAFPHTDLDTLNQEDLTIASITPAVRLQAPGTLNWITETLANNKEGIVHFVPYNSYYPNSRFGMDFDHFSMPEMKEAVGQKLPWTILNLTDETISNLKTIGLKIRDNADKSNLKSSDLVPLKPEECSDSTYSLVRFPDNKPYEFLTDDNGIILAVGHDIIDLQKQQDLKKQQENNQKKHQVFVNRLKVLNNLTVLTILEKKSQTQPLTELELKKQAEITQALIETPNLEPYLLTPQISKNINFDTNNRTIKHLQEHTYDNMPDDAPEISADYDKLKSSIYYRYFAQNETEATTSKAQKEKISAMLKMNTGENTTSTLKLLLPTIEKILDKREQNPQFKDEYNIIYSHRTDCVLSTIEEASPNMPESVQNLSTAVMTTHYSDKSNIVENLNQFTHGLILGFPNDQKYYTAHQSPYYEKIREIYHLAPTDNNPEQLYANLTSTFTENEELGNKYIDRQNSENTFHSRENMKKVTIGSHKLNCNLHHNEPKIAEYETMRYINNPQNTEPLDLKKLMIALPKYETVNNFALNGYSQEFKSAISDYIFNKSNFEQLDFASKRDIYEQMLHKNMINQDNYDSLRFLESIKKSYQQLPEEEKQQAALSMLKDSNLSYQSVTAISQASYKEEEKTDSFSKLPIPEYRNFFIEEYGIRLSKELGLEPINNQPKKNEKLDNGNEDNRTEEQKIFDKKIDDFINMVNNDMQKSSVKDKLFEIVAEKAEIQTNNARKFNLNVKHIASEADVSIATDLTTRGTAVFEEVLNIVPENNVDMINYLNTPYSEESQRDFREHFAEHTIQKFSEEEPLDERAKDNIRKAINSIPKEDMYILHKEFWDKDIKTRAAITQRLLNNYCGDDVTKMTDFLVDKYIDKEHPYYQDTKDILNTLYAPKPENEADKSGYYPPDTARFMIGAMLSAKEPSTDKSQNNMGIGEGLAMFCSNNGPAWVKFGQALSNIPNLPDDIRKPLSVLKDNAVKLPRWELFDRIEANLSEDKLSKIQKIGKLLGAGSFFSSISAVHDDNSTTVIQFMQKDAKKDADREFARLKRTIKDLSEQDKKYAVLGTIVDRANESTKTEVDINKGYEQYTVAEKNYRRIESLEVNGVKFNLNLLPWVDHTQNETNGTGYKEMEFAKGKGLNSVSATPEEKRILSAGYISTELGILLSGKAWDIDRHSGQQNFDIIRDEKGAIKEVNVGIFDTGAVRPAPNAEEKKQIAGFYANVLLAVAQGEDVNDVMFKEVQKLEESGKDASYVSDIQRGSIALLGMMEYQPEEKDKSGKVTTSSQSLSGTDFLRISGAIVKSGMADHEIIDPLMSKFIKGGKEIFRNPEKRKKMAIKFLTNQLKEKLSNIFHPKKLAKLEIKMSATGIKEAERQNARIDKENNNNPETNPYDIKPSNTSNKTEQQEMKKANKFARNLQAAYIKHTRQ